MEGDSGPAPKLRIVADHREAKSGVIEYLRATPGVALEFRQLRTGDYQVEDECLFERKSIRDFAASIIDTRLFTQASRLSRCSLPVAVIIEGDRGDLDQLGMRREALQGAVISLSLIFQIHVFRSFDAEETARLLGYAAGQLRRLRGDAVPRPGYRPKSMRRLQLHILQGLPGIGPRRAQDLLEHFGCVTSVMSAGATDLAAVNRIGTKTAERIRSILDAPW